MPQETKAKGVQGGKVDLSAILGAEAPSLQGLTATREDESALVDALEKAFDYRGDVSLTLAGGELLTGYIFDRRGGGSLAGSSLRLMVAPTGEKREIRYDQLASVEFTGRDPARGKSFETWLKKYVEKKLAGEEASIHSEPLE